MIVQCVCLLVLLTYIVNTQAIVVPWVAGIKLNGFARLNRIIKIMFLMECNDGFTVRCLSRTTSFTTKQKRTEIMKTLLQDAKIKLSSIDSPKSKINAIIELNKINKTQSSLGKLPQKGNGITLIHKQADECYTRFKAHPFEIKSIFSQVNEASTDAIQKNQKYIPKITIENPITSLFNTEHLALNATNRNNCNAPSTSKTRRRITQEVHHNFVQSGILDCMYINMWHTKYPFRQQTRETCKRRRSLEKIKEIVSKETRLLEMRTKSCLGPLLISSNKSIVKSSNEKFDLLKTINDKRKEVNRRYNRSKMGRNKQFPVSKSEKCSMNSINMKISVGICTDKILFRKPFY